MNTAKARFVWMILVIFAAIFICFPSVHQEGHTAGFFGPGVYIDRTYGITEMLSQDSSDCDPIAALWLILSVIPSLLVFTIPLLLKSRYPVVTRTFMGLGGLAFLFTTLIAIFFLTFQLFSAPKNLTFTSAYIMVLEAVSGLLFILAAIRPLWFKR